MELKLYKAATSGKIQLLSEVADADIVAPTAPHENTALHIAARHGHAEFIMAVFRRCPQILTMQNSQGDTPLHCAAGAGCPEAITALFPANAEGGSAGILRMQNQEGNTALHQALTYRRTRAAIMLLQRDPQLAFVVNAAQESPLHLAAKEELQEFVQELLSQTASSNPGKLSVLGSSFSLYVYH